MRRSNRYPRTPIIFLLMVFFSLTVMGNVDSRVSIGGFDWDFAEYIEDSRDYVALEEDLEEACVFAFEEEMKEVAQVSVEVAKELEPELELEVVTIALTPVRAQVADDTRPEVTSRRPQGAIHVHRVQSGQTLAIIARSYGTTVDSIMASNNLTNANRIRVGQELQIPRVSGIIHTVSSGESVWEIARRYNVTVEQIVAANELRDASTIVPSMNLVIPGATAVLIRDVLVVSGQLQKVFDRPVSGGYVSSPFGYRSFSLGSGMHNGVDIAVPVGTPIRASADGRVVTVANQPSGYGLYVSIDHGSGVETRYAHNSRNVVSVGQEVKKGQIIAYSGATGRVTGPHIHFEIRYRGSPVDPQRFLR